MKRNLFACFIFACFVSTAAGLSFGQDTAEETKNDNSSDTVEKTDTPPVKPEANIPRDDEVPADDSSIGDSKTSTQRPSPDTAGNSEKPSGDTPPAEQGETLPPVTVITSQKKAIKKPIENAAKPVGKIPDSGSALPQQPVTQPVAESTKVLRGLSIKTGRELESNGDDRLSEVIRNVPNVNITNFGDGRSTSVNVRGVGALRDALSPNDASFIVYVDGVPQPLFAADTDFLDLEQVEVLKGPQGTRFGRSSTAGALVITTRKPGDKPEFSVRGEVGEDGHTLAEVIASGPIIPQLLAGRLAIRFSGVDGFVPNTLTGNNLGEQDIISGRGTLRLTPSSSTSVTLAINADQDERTFPFFILRDAPGFPIASLSVDNNSKRRIEGGTLTIEHEAKDFAFKSITGVTHLETTDLLIDDSEGFVFSRITGFPRFLFANNDTFSDWTEDEKSVSQEFQFSSLQNDRFAWVVGANYFLNRFNADYLNENAFVPATTGRRRNKLESDSFAGFGEIIVPAGPGFRITTGARFTHEKKTYDLQYTGLGAPGTVDSFRDAGELHYNYATGRMSFALDVTPNGTAHVTVSRGYNSGGYPRFVNSASLGIPTEPYASSKAWTYEAGYKYRAPAKSGFFDVTAFYNDIKDEQLLDFDSAVFSFRPANVDVISYGLELSGGISVTDAITLTGGLGYTEAEFVNVGPNQAVAGAKNGNRPPNIPKLTVSAALDYRQAIEVAGLGFAAGQVFGNIAWDFVGERAADEENSYFLDAYHIINGRIGVEPVKGIEIYAFGKNLLDTNPQLSGAFVFPNAEVVVAGRGRVLGVGTSARW